MEISRRKKREKSSSRENSQKKGLLISNKKKKSEKGGRQGAAAGKVQTMAPSRAALALPHPLSGQPIHSCFFGSLALSPGPSSLAATRHARRRACDRRPSSSCWSETTARITPSGKANRKSRCCVVVVVNFGRGFHPCPVGSLTSAAHSSTDVLRVFSRVQPDRQPEGSDSTTIVDTISTNVSH